LEIMPRDSKPRSAKPVIKTPVATVSPQATADCTANVLKGGLVSGAGVVIPEEQVPAWFRHNGFPDLPNLQCGGENWWSYFARLNTPGATVNPADVLRAVTFWEHWGSFLAATPETGVWGLLTVRIVCLRTATTIICEECERRGWDSSPIPLVTDFRDGMFLDYPETVAHSCPWPPHDFVVQNPTLPDYRRAQLHAAERMLERLKVVLRPARGNAVASGQRSPQPEYGGQTIPGVCHSPDFLSVAWFGESYTFNKSQAACVAVLWAAAERGTPELHQTTILAEADEQNGLPRDAYGRLIDVFRKKTNGKREKHPAWGTLIIQGTSRGAFRLAPKGDGPRKTHS
jgi:hypothetical protein